MKKNANGIIVSVLMCFIFTACNKNENSLKKNKNSLVTKEKQNINSKIFKAKLITSFCAYNIVQIQDSDFFSYGMNWTDPQGKTYQHVFSVKNYCDFAAVNLKADETFNCKIIEKATIEDCVVCMGFMETPPLYHNINIVK